MSLSHSTWPCFTEEEAEAVRDVILSNKVNYWTGNKGREFEAEFAKFANCDYAVALANGTVALDVAIVALGIGHGDEVIVTPRTFIASVSSVVNAGAVPIFADVDLNDGNINVETIKEKVTERTKAIVVVHLAGHPADMRAIMEFAESRGLKVIEDCAQAHGAKIDGRSVGSFGHVGCWSFCQDKILTTGGEGGMVTTNDRNLWSSMWSYKDHGKSWDSVYVKEHKPGFRWVHDSFGTNWRMLEVQAMIGLIQLEKMPTWTMQRNRNAQAIWNAANSVEWLRTPYISAEMVHACYKCYVYIDEDKAPEGVSRDELLREFSENGVLAYSGTCSEVYMEKAFDSNYRPKTRLRNAQELGRTSLMFLCHPTLTELELGKTVKVLNDLRNV